MIEQFEENRDSSSKLGAKLPYFIGAIAFVILIFTGREFFLSNDETAYPERAFSGPLIGEIQSIEGQVLIRPPRGTRFEAAKLGPYRAESVLQTQASSAVVVQFLPGPTLRLLENSRLVAELDPLRDGAVQATLLAGEISILDPGTNPQFTLMQNGIALPLLAGEAPRTVPLIRIEQESDSSSLQGAVAPGDLEQQLSEKLEIEKESESVSPPSVDPSPTATPTTTRAETESSALLRSTLTNDDIRSQVRSQAGTFQKCYVTMVNRMSESRVSMGALPKGETLVTFKILPTGLVEDPHVLRSPFKDPTFERCITQALSRLRFRQFQGAAIPVGEFPIVLE